MTDTTLPPSHHAEPAAAPQPPRPPAPSSSPPRGPRRWAAVVVSALVAGVVSASVTGLMMTRATSDEPAATGAGRQAAPVVDSAADGTDIASVAAAVAPSVVHISVASMAGEGSGSGVILREDGYVVTNAHVVDGASQVQVTLADGSLHDAEVVGADEASDLAVVRVEADEPLPAATFAERPPRVGDLAVAIGSPFGLEGSVTSGIVSALNRSLPGGQGAALVNMIQTDAAINPGNSGGALVNAASEVIGINTAILSRSGANNGIGFAIPVTSALPIAEQLIEKGHVDHAQLGIQGQDVDPEAADLYNLDVDRGALVVAVSPDSAAAEAGLQRGDIITSIDGDEVTSMADLAGAISSRVPGDDVRLTVVRAGETLTVDVTLGSAPPQ